MSSDLAQTFFSSIPPSKVPIDLRFLICPRCNTGVKRAIATIVFWIGLSYAVCGGCFGGCLTISTSLGDRAFSPGENPPGRDPVQQRGKILIATALVGVAASVGSAAYLIGTRRDRNDD